MKCTFFSVLALLPALIAAAPPKRDGGSGPSDIDVLQFALTLEHLENAFYSTYLAKYDANAFKKAGFAPFVRGRFEQIASHEATHVKFLESVIGPSATKPCTYNFPVHDPKSFAALSATFEGVGTSAYLGAAQFLHDKNYLEAAGSILSTEARQNAWVNSVANQAYPWSAAFDVPLTFNEAYSLAAGFIVSCPPSNPQLIGHALPKLSLSSQTPGSKPYLTFANPHGSQQLYLALLQSYVQTVFLPIDLSDYSVRLPKTGELHGTIYSVVTTKSSGDVEDEDIVAGVVILTYPYPSYV